MPSTTSQSTLQNQQPNDFNVSSALRYLQRTLSVVILNLDLSAVLDQSPRDLQMAVSTCHMQRRLQVSILNANICAVLDLS